MIKNYSPVHIRNPSSKQHLVHLHPGQNLVLTLDRNPDDSKSVVEISGNNLEIDGSMVERNKDWFFIRPKDYTTSWAQYSSTFMGEIWIEFQNHLSRLIVIQGCTNKPKINHYTAINPNCLDVRIRPHNILEVVLYDLNFTYQDEWNWTWNPSCDGLEIELLGQDVLSLYHTQKKEGDDPNYQYAMCPRLDTDSSSVQGIGYTTLCRQHHYWFRFNKGIVQMSKDRSEVLYVGDLEFSGRASKFLPNSKISNLQASVYIDFRKSKIGRILDTLTVKKLKDTPRLFDSSSSTFPPSNFSTSNLPVANRKYKYEYRPKKILPTIKEVVIKRLDGDIHDGCKVLSAQPSATQMMAYDEYDIMKYFDEHPDQMPHWKY